MARSQRPFRLSLLLAILGGLAATAARPAQSPQGPACTVGPTRLCLQGRFTVEAATFDRSGRERAATARSLSPASGSFSFFAADGVDLLVQVGAARQRGEPAELRFGTLTDAGFTLRVRDTLSGAEWRFEGDRGTLASGSAPLAPSAAERVQRAPVQEPAAAPFMVADLLEQHAEAVDGSVGTGPDDSLCATSATDLCLLGDRFRARLFRSGGNRYTSAPPMGGRGESGVLARDGDGLVGLRILDGRAVNGHFWLVAASLDPRDVMLEVTDLARGRTRRYSFPGGTPAVRADLQAFGESAATVHVTLDPSRAVRATLGIAGGSLVATDGQGTSFRLAIPAQALDTPTEVKLTPVVAVAGLPFSGGLKAAVRIEPEGLIPAVSGLLTITPATPVAPSQQLTFSFRGLAGELYLSPPKANQAALVLPVHRFGGYGLAAGTAADLAAQLQRQPSHAEDRLTQRLAGLLLPLRRAGKGLATALPASVLHLLQSEFTANIAPKLALIQNGAVLTYLPVTRNFTSSVQDTGLTASVLGARSDPDVAARARRPTAAERIAAAQVAGARRALASALAACKSQGPPAAVRAYKAYSVLRLYRKQTAQDAAKVKGCVSFELSFDTEISQTVGTNTFARDTVPRLRLPLSLDLAKGSFSGADTSIPQTEAFSVSSPCSAKQTARQLARLKTDQVLINALGQYDDGEELTALGMAAHVFYVLTQAPMVTWLITCPGLPPGSMVTSWASPYTINHFAEFNLSSNNYLGDFHMVMGPSADSRKIAEKAYQVSNAVESEDTFFFLLHTPR